jgi:dipeptidase E
MKLLLTSGGITNDTLAYELETLVGKPFSELKIGFIPTASLHSAENKNWLIQDLSNVRARGADVFIMSLADLEEHEILQRLEAVDVILMGGGNNYYLSYMLQQKGLFDALPELLKTKVYMGISAGSMIMAPSAQLTSNALNAGTFLDPDNDSYGPEGKTSARTLSLVDFHIRPHFRSEHFPFGEELIQEVANKIGAIVYMLDDDCAVRVVDGEVSAVGEGEWRHITPEGK